MIGLSYVIRKDLCEARVNLEVSSNLADEPPSADGPPQVHKTWQMNLLFLADEPSLANGPPQVHKTWQMNLLWPMDPPGTQNLADEPTFSGR